MQSSAKDTNNRKPIGGGGAVRSNGGAIPRRPVSSTIVPVKKNLPLVSSNYTECIYNRINTMPPK